MASSLRLITSNPIARSFRPTVVSASRFLSIQRSYTTLPVDDFYDQSWPRILSPHISSIHFSMIMTAETRTLRLSIDENVTVELNMPGLKKENMRACADQHNNMFIQDKTQFTNKDDIMTKIIANITANFRDMSTKRAWPYSGNLFADRSIIGRELCPVIAMLSPINVFSISKEETAEKLYTIIRIYEHEEMKLTKQGLLISSLYEFSKWKREDIKTFFNYDTFFIEGIRKNKHSIIGIRLPEGFHKKHSMVKREMDIGQTALLACVK
ncbi:hypothetical protein Hanom_Chr08g00708401 [Helianthus anomalus]